ncbi:GxxExxY protein [Candidatus Omnitrophota bacterium]
MSINEKYLYSPLTNRIINIAIKVHKKLGPGFIEKIYERALEYELTKNDLKFEKQKAIRVRYEEIFLGDQRIDFLIENKVILELKAVSEITGIHIAQIISYLKAMNKKVGLILNFAKNKLEIKRTIV